MPAFSVVTMASPAARVAPELEHLTLVRNHGMAVVVDSLRTSAATEQGMVRAFALIPVFAALIPVVACAQTVDGPPCRRVPALSQCARRGRRPARAASPDALVRRPPPEAVMDTGSTGVVVSASAIPGFEQLPKNGPARLTYTSSGRIMEGVWVSVPVTIAGANGASVTTRPMPVLAVTSVDCTGTARKCTPRDDPRQVAMIGMGFGRRNRSGPQADSSTDKNAFLNLLGTRAGAVHRGYLITRDGVELGAPAIGAPLGFITVHLARNQETGDWSGAPACIAIADHSPACGTVLPDTGLTQMFLALPPDQVEGRAIPAGNDHTLPPGTKVTITLAPATPGAKPIAGYSFAATTWIIRLPRAGSSWSAKAIGRPTSTLAYTCSTALIISTTPTPNRRVSPRTLASIGRHRAAGWRRGARQMRRQGWIFHA